MEIFGALMISSMAGLATVLGGLVVFFKIKERYINKFITIALSFSLAIMIGISVTDLIPESLFLLLRTLGVTKGLLYVFLAFGLGVVLIKYLNKIILKSENSNNLYKLGILNMLALILHNFPEGIATFMSSYKDINLGIKLSIAIALHNIPEGISIAVPIYYATKSKSKALIRTFLSGLAEPLGALIAYIFLARFITDKFISLILIFVGGIMITLAIEVILPKAQEYNYKWHLRLGLLIGFLLIIINYLMF